MSKFYEHDGEVTELYEKDGKIGILVSPGYGAGWSTWNKPELAYDKRVIEFYLKKVQDEEFMTSLSSFADSKKHDAAVEESGEFFKSIGYENCPYMGGFGTVVLKFVPYGTPWKIDVYDGYESLVTPNDSEFITF